MAKVFYFNIPSWGHIYPSLAVVKELIARGNQVIYFCSENARASIEATGATFRPYPIELDMTQLDADSSRSNFVMNALAFTRFGEQILPTLVKAIKEEAPDIIVHDSLASWGRYAAVACGVPSIGAFVIFVLTRTSMPPIPMRTVFDSVLGMVKVMPEYWQISGRMEQQVGVRPSGLMKALMMEGDHNIVFTSKMFQPSGETFDDSYQFVGPCITDRQDNGDFPFDQLQRRPLIYISLGTIANDNVPFYHQCFEAFSKHPGQFVLSVGRKINLSVLGTPPENFMVRPFVPQLELLKRVDLFVTHGGMNSVQEGLFNNVPLVVIPQQAEQSIVARQVVKHGAGIMLGGNPPYDRVNITELRNAVDTVLSNEAFRTAACELGESFRVGGRQQRAADEIIRFGESHKTPTAKISG